MNLQQLRSVCEVARRDLNLTRAARHLFPSVTAHVGLPRGSTPGPLALHLIGLFAPRVRRALEARLSTPARHSR